MVFEGVWMMSGWCLMVSGEASIPNQLAKNILGHDTLILLFLEPCIAYKCLCLGVSELCLGVSGWGLMMSGDELMQNILAPIYIGHVNSDIAFYSSPANT